MRILITGGAGFIGTALSEKLNKLGHDVTIIDLDNRFSDFHLKNFRSIPVDIRSYSNFQILKHHRFDLIYHLAAQTSAVISQEQPELDIDTNVKGTLNVCNFSRTCGARKIVFSSSMAVYGNKSGKISEQNTLEPVSNYGASKVSAEIFIKMFEQFGIRNTIFRIFNAYGPGQDMKNLRQGMASIFLAQSITDTKIEVTGVMDRYRDFIYIDDVVKALALALHNMDGKVFNIGSGTKTTVKELIDTIIDINEKPNDAFTVYNIGEHEGDQFGTVADISNITNFGWEPEVNMYDGLVNMYRYAREKLQ
jgi:UDP-glucose 4-epimerase